MALRSIFSAFSSWAPKLLRRGRQVAYLTHRLTLQQATDQWQREVITPEARKIFSYNAIPPKINLQKR